MKKLTSWIAWRYLLSRRVGHFGPLLTVVAIVSVAIGMFSLIVVMSVMRGFKAELSDRLLGFNSHITLSRTSDEGPPLDRKDVEDLINGESIRDIAPFVQGEVIVKSHTTGELLAQGARVRGIEADRMGAMEGMIFSFFPGENVLIGRDGLPGAIIGKEIVTQLAVHPDFKDTIEIIAPLADIGPNGEMVPNQRKFAVTGLFEAGLYDYDAKYVLLSIDDARRLLGQQAEEGWQIRIYDTDDASRALLKIHEKLPKGWKAVGWHEQNKKLFAALKLERIAMSAILVMALLIASFSISGVILLITAAKRKDVAILKSVGMKSRDVVCIFLSNSAFIGLIGSCIGLVGGLALCLAIEKWPIRLPDSYYLDFLPVDLNPFVAVLFSALGVAIAIAAAIYPVMQAVRTDVIEVLRYE